MKKISFILIMLLAVSARAEQPMQWLSGDFHQHTYYTDGSTTFNFVMEKNMEFGLDWWANSEHGGERTQNGSNFKWDDPNVYTYNPILGNVKMSGGHQVMYRWQSLRDFVWPDILAWRNTLKNLKSNHKIFSGLEWNVPGHEHCSTAIVDNNAAAISAFEYMFDKSDSDTSRDGEVTRYGVLSKDNKNDQSSINACAWMQSQYDAGNIQNGWIVWAHVERAGTWNGSSGGYNVENFRTYNDIAPDICFGFEGIPGHQPDSNRGGFGSGAVGGGTYGGAGIYIATVGGLWDAMLGEGRHFFNYASSDYHSHTNGVGGDFYPGEYQRTWVSAIDDNNDGDYDLNEIADALRSGNSWNVMGDLINYLDFSAAQGSVVAPMGSDLQAQKGQDVTLTIKFASPLKNNNGDTPIVNHIDLIAGEITGKIDPASADYTNATNPTTQVIKTFTSADWTKDASDLNVITVKVPADKNMYYRLRGTNQGLNTPYETENGNPLADSLATQNLGLDGAAEAWADLWFYSNPIFVYAN